MDIRTRLLRKPFRTVLWQILLIAMSVLIGLGGTVFCAANRLTEILDRNHTTAAMQNYYERTNAYGFAEPAVALTEAEIEYLQGLDTVELVDLRTLTGAYIPQLTAAVGLIPWGDLHPLNADHMAHRNLNDSYNQVAVVGTVEDSWIVEGDFGYTDLSVLGRDTLATVCYHYAILNVEELLVMNEAFDVFPTEQWSYYSGRVFVQTIVYDEAEEPWFQTGARYLVTGSYDPSCHGMSTHVRHTPQGVSLPWIEVMEPWMQDVTYGIMEEDRLVIYQDAQLSYPTREDIDRFERLDSVGEPAVVAQRLTGTAEQLLARDDAWAQRVEKLQMAQHTFPVLGTQALETMQYFITGDAAIAEGRMFTREEYDTGASVCVISETLAQSGGIGVGDTLSVSQYLVAESYEDGNYSIPEGWRDEEANEPAVGTAIIPEGFVTEDETFTVVGIYRLSRSWQDTAFAFTPNTVFIPQRAQIEGGFGGPARLEKQRTWHTLYKVTEEQTTNEIEWEGWQETDVLRPRGSYGVYMSVKLKNGTMERFLEQIENSWMPTHRFLTFDQGYEEAQQGIRAVVEAARRLFGLAAVGWAILLLFYVLLCQSRERRNLGIMRSVGARVGQTRRYLFAGGFLPAALGVLIGTALTGSVTALVQDKLTELLLTTSSGGKIRGAAELSEMLSQSHISVEALLALALGQLAVAAAVLWLHAAAVSRKNTRKLLGV